MVFADGLTDMNISKFQQFSPLVTVVFEVKSRNQKQAYFNLTGHIHKVTVAIQISTGSVPNLENPVNILAIRVLGMLNKEFLEVEWSSATQPLCKLCL